MKKTFTLFSILIILGTKLQLKAQPIKLWEKTVIGTGNSTDEFVSVVADAAGNSYFTGYSSEAGNGNDYVTVKYNPKGYVLWRATYNGSAGTDDKAIKVLLHGNYIYVTGTSGGSGTGKDIVTIQYNATTGSQIWSQRFNNIAANGDDRAADMELNSITGDVFIAGISYKIFNPSTNNTDDGILIKYNPAGTEVWKKFDYSTFNNDITKDIAVSSSGKIYVPIRSVGSITTIYVFNSDGTTSKVCNPYTTTEFDVRSIVVDGSDNFYTLANYGLGTTILKVLNNSQFADWQKSSNTEMGIKLVIDEYDDLYALQYDSVFNHPATSYCIRKYAGTNGMYLVDSIAYNPTSGLDYPTDLLVKNNRIYVTGYGPGTGQRSVHTIGFDSNDGSLQWQLDEVCSNTKNQSPNGIALDNFNNIYIAGKGGCNTNDDALAVKYCNSFPPKPTISILFLPLQTSLTSSASQYNQWWFNGDSLTNSNSVTYNITSSPQFGYYIVEVSFAGCSTFSDSLIIDSIRPTGIDELSIHYNLYPNPAANLLTINLGGLQAEQVSIYNVDGKLVSETKQPTNNRVDISGLAKGVYIAEIKVRDAVQRVRWVKM